MGIVLKHHIEPENVHNLSLQEILGNKIDARDQFELTEALVRNIVLSRFKERRDASQILLNYLYGKRVYIHTMPDQDRIYTYVNFRRNREYIFVSTYLSKDIAPFIELVPDNKEMNFFRKLVLEYRKFDETSIS